MAQVDTSKVAAMLSIVNELIRRVGDYRVKEAQYEEHAEMLSKEIADNLTAANLLSEENRETLKDTLKKSASAALDVLHSVAKTAASAQVPASIGTPYAVAGSVYGPSFGNKRYVEVDDLVIDISKYR